MQSLLTAIYPAHCASCGETVEGDGGLCGSCWRETQFVFGHACDLCGVPLPGDSDGARDHCDACLSIARPWAQGRTALLYKNNGRRLVLQLKHADRPDIAGPAAVWMAQAATPLLAPGTLIVPVPAHWTRMVRRRYNQAAELARALGRVTGHRVASNALVRSRGGATQEGKSFDERFANLQGAVRPHPRRAEVLIGRRVLLVDDVMTSGATLASTTEAAFAAGASEVRVVTLARVASEGPHTYMSVKGPRAP